MEGYPKYIVVYREGDHGVVMATPRLFNNAEDAYEYATMTNDQRIAIVVEVLKPFYEKEK